MIAAVRRTASPYARRLARDRGIALAKLSGTGPSGRIVAADIEAFIAAPPPPAIVGAAAVSAFSTTIDLGKAQSLAGEFAGAKIAISLDDMLLRAAGWALHDASGTNRVPQANGFIEPEKPAIAWEVGKGAERRELVFADAHLGVLTALAMRRVAAFAASDAEPGTAALSLCRLQQSGIRPVSMPLLPGRAMRLVIVIDDGERPAECLLCFDARAIDETDAAAFLARFRDNLETPLRLLA